LRLDVFVLFFVQTQLFIESFDGLRRQLLER